MHLARGYSPSLHGIGRGASKRVPRPLSREGSPKYGAGAWEDRPTESLPCGSLLPPILATLGRPATQFTKRLKKTWGLLLPPMYARLSGQAMYTNSLSASHAMKSPVGSQSALNGLPNPPSELAPETGSVVSVQVAPLSVLFACRRSKYSPELRSQRVRRR